MNTFPKEFAKDTQVSSGVSMVKHRHCTPHSVCLSDVPIQNILPWATASQCSLIQCRWCGGTRTQTGLLWWGWGLTEVQALPELVLLLPRTGWFSLNPHIPSLGKLLCPQTKSGAPNRADSVVWELFPAFPMDCEPPGALIMSCSLLHSSAGT